MLKYTYKNATVYITKPAEEHIKNVQKATEVFMKRVIKDELRNGVRKVNYRTCRNTPGSRKRNNSIKK